MVNRPTDAPGMCSCKTMNCLPRGAAWVAGIAAGGWTAGVGAVSAEGLLADTASKTSRSATTGEQGEYQFLFLPPGTYMLTVTAGGFQRYEQTGLQLLVNTPATANVQLKLGQSTEQVTVTGCACPGPCQYRCDCRCTQRRLAG